MSFFQDLKISEILNEAEEIHKKFTSLQKFNIENVKKSILYLQSQIKFLQAICRRMADISNMGTQQINLINKIIMTENKLNAIDPQPNGHTHAFYKNQITGEKKELIKNVSIAVKPIQTEHFIGYNELYYDMTRKEYIININGYNVRGNFCRIEKHPKKNYRKCKDGPKCKDIKNCQWWHSQDERLENNINAENYRSLSNGSWLYSSLDKHDFNRHIGGLDTIENDISTMSKKQYEEEVEIREAQLMHDILVFLILTNNGMVKRFAI
jgi:hypothetical protein